MKNIFKKNHIIITALAIMIVIAGYLSFTNRDIKEDAGVADTANSDTDEYDEFTELDGLDVAAENDTTETDSSVADTVTDSAVTDTDAATTDATDTDAATTNDETAPVDNTTETGEADISDEDILADAQDVSDNGEINLEEGVPGEAVLASTTIDAGFFVSSRIDREQVRAQSKADLMDMIKSTEISDELKKEAIDKMLELTDIRDKENKAEKLLEAKGFDGTLVYIVDNQVDVIVNAETLSEQQLAIIEDVVKRETEFEVKNIHIATVVVDD